MYVCMPYIMEHKKNSYVLYYRMEGVLIYHSIFFIFFINF